MKLRISFLLLFGLSVAIAPAEPESPDILIYGTTPGGISAGLAAAQEGEEVLLVEPTARIGGLLTHGLSHSDFHSFEALSGSFLQFSKRVEAYYANKYGEDSQQVVDSFRGTHGEPSVNLLVLQEMIAEQPTITVWSEHRLESVEVSNDRVQSVKLRNAEGELVEVTPRLVMDATYEGDLISAAGVPYRLGRESRSEYGESLAPEEADDQLQAYNFRLCMTPRADNRVPIPVPEGYDREDYAAIVPLVEEGRILKAFGYPGKCLLKAHEPALPNGKYDINDVSKGLVRLSLPGENLDYPEGDLEKRERIAQKHLDWQFGLIHFAQTDPALPKEFRDEAATWGLCRDEFAETGHIPAQIYVRQARRMVGMHVYTEKDTEYALNDARAVLHRDSIAVGEYSHNCHGTGHEGPRIGGRHVGEFYKAVAPYQIPYGVIVPDRMVNLLAPVPLSASHVGFCALRLEPIWMSLGDAAGFAAHLALEAEKPVQEVDVTALQARIWKSGGATVHFNDVLPGHPGFAAVQWWGGLGGFHGVEPAPEKLGSRGKHITSQYFEAFPGHTANLDEALTEPLAKQWAELAEQDGIPAAGLLAADGEVTRAEWIRAAYAVAKP